MAIAALAAAPFGDGLRYGLIVAVSGILGRFRGAGSALGEVVRGIVRGNPPTDGARAALGGTAKAALHRMRAPRAGSSRRASA